MNLEADPRFKAILARIVANRDAQVMELERLHASGMNAAEARAEYLAKLASAKAR